MWQSGRSLEIKHGVQLQVFSRVSAYVEQLSLLVCLSNTPELNSETLSPVPLSSHCWLLYRKLHILHHSFYDTVL